MEKTEKICDSIKTVNPGRQCLSGFPLWVGGELLSHTSAVSSSRRGLTSLFGMGRGAPPRHSRHSFLNGLCGWAKAGTRTPPHGAHPPSPPTGHGRAQDRSVRAISAARLNVSQRSHLRPIHVVVYHGPPRRPHLGAGFALRCIQRLSRPDAATRPCAWRRNRHTVGPSDPVLSY